MDQTLLVHKGQPITAALWNRLVAAVRAGRVLSGDGVRLRSTPQGTIISAAPGGSPWVHPFMVTLSGSGATVRYGQINAVEPTIGGVPISGTSEEPAPVLRFREPKLDVQGRGYIALEVVCDEKWWLKRAEVVQVAALDSLDGAAPPEGAGTPIIAGGSPGLPGRKARHALAMLRQRGNGQLALFQIEFFNLQHRVDARSGADAGRHFFWPA